jgi:cobalt transporter subunit CbtB
MARHAQVGETARIETRTQQRLVAATAAILMGVFLVVGVGFASPDTIHNAAHDSRHSFAFPCH